MIYYLHVCLVAYYAINYLLLLYSEVLWAMSKVRTSEKELLEEMTHINELSTVTLKVQGLEQNGSHSEEDKMRLVCSRFSDINEDDLMEGDEFYIELDSGWYD